MADEHRADLRDERRQAQIIPPDDAESREDQVRLYNAAPRDMPPAAGGANADIGGEAAASRRVAGLPPELERLPGQHVGEPSPGAEPFLGYDALPTDEMLAWLGEADPGPRELRTLFDYERTHRDREAVLHELKERLRRNGQRPGANEA